MFKTFIILKYFHIQTSAIKRKYPTLIVRIFLVSAFSLFHNVEYAIQLYELQSILIKYLPTYLPTLPTIHSISRYIHIQTLCVHKRNVLRFLQHGTYHVVVRGGSPFCQSPKGGGQKFFLLKRKGGPTLFWEKNTKIPQPSPPQEKTYLP